MEPGASATVEHVVTASDTASAFGSGSVDVLATPRLLALCEQASVEALAGSLDANTTSVGVEVRIDHVAASPIGRHVWAEATLEKIKGRKLYFTVSARDDRGLVAVGKVVRVVVDTASFMAKCSDGA